MIALRVFLRYTAFISFLILVTCASKSTNFNSVWKDETYQGRPEKILVVSTFTDSATRKIFEDDFVTSLKNRKITAVASYTIMPNLVASDKDAISIQAKAIGADTLLISIPSDATLIDKYVAGGQVGDWYINMKTDIYDVNSQRTIMNASSVVHIVSYKTRTDQIQSYVNDFVNMLSRHKLF